jgi:predicted nucleotidyltransferase
MLYIDFGNIDKTKIKTRTDMEVAVKHYLLELFAKSFNSPYEVFLIGSRAKGTHTSASDFDLVIKGEEMNRKKYFYLMDKINDSFIPFHIDLLIYSNLSEEFKKEAFKKMVKWV